VSYRRQRGLVGRGVRLVIERLQSLGLIPDAVAHRCVLGKDTYCCFPLCGQAVYPLWWPSLTKDMQTEELLCWSGMTDTEHSATSSSNEEDVSYPRIQQANLPAYLHTILLMLNVKQGSCESYLKSFGLTRQYNWI